MYSLESITKVVDGLNLDTINYMANVDNYSLLQRHSVIDFINHWTVEDPSHQDYLDNLTDGFDPREALMIGDMVAFHMLIGFKGTVNTTKGNEWAVPADARVRWKESTPKLAKKMPAGVDTTDLIGLHIMLVGMLPIKNYNMFTIYGALIDNPLLMDEIKGTQVPLNEAEYETIQTLSKIVATGGFEQLKLAMLQASDKEGLQKLAKQTGNNLGHFMMDAFNIASDAVREFKAGNPSGARIHLETLENNYEIGQKSFSYGLDTMFIGNMCKMVGSKDSRKAIGKGELAKPMMISLDTSGEFGLDAARAVAMAAGEPVKVIEDDNGKWKNSGGDATGSNGLFTLTNDKNARGTMTNWAYLLQIAENYKNQSAPKQAKDVKPSGNSRDFGPIKFIVHGIVGEESGRNLVPKAVLTIRTSKANKAGGGKSRPDIEFTMDLTYEDFGLFPTQARTRAEAVAEEAAIVQDDILAQMDMGNANRRGVKASKKSSKKRVSKAQTIAVELTPASQIDMNTAVESADWYKRAQKGNPELKELWNKFARQKTGIRPKIKRVRNRLVWIWKGNSYEADAENSRQMPKALEEKMKSEKTYADYKKGQTTLRMVYARRKDNDSLVPFRIFFPKILVRKGNNGRLLAKSGSASTKNTKKLIELLERDFGPIVFKKDMPGAGFDRVIPSGKDRVKIIRIDRGVHHLYKAEGLDTPSGFSTKAFPSFVRPDGTMTYMAMQPDGRVREFEVQA